jgi:hypothetical protein
MKRIFGALAALSALAILSGCASIQSAGHVVYTVKPNADGRYELTVQDGKEFSGRTIQFSGNTGELVIQEGESKAFKGQAISAKALSVFPVTDLANILSGNAK